MNAWRRRWLTIVAGDPGGARFRTAVRVSLASAATLAASTPIIVAMRQPEPVSLFGVIIAMTAQVAVADSYDDEQRRTWMCVGPGAVVGAAAGLLVARRPLVRDLLFPAIVFAVVYVRHFGQRLSAIGMTAFMAYFDAIVLRLPLTALPVVAATIGAGAVTGFIVRFWIVPESSVVTLRWASRSLGASAALRAESAPAVRAADTRRVMTTALAVDRQVAALEEAGALDVRSATDLRCRIVAYQIDAQRGGRLLRLALPALQAHARVPVVNFNPVSPQRFPRQAIQACCGSAAAVALGEWMSPTHWYWAVIAAFVVFNRAPTVGHTFARALARVGGTVLGLVAGLVIADALPPRPAVELPLIFLGTGIAYYFLKVSYVWTLVWFTICLALLYSIMGQFSPGVMYVRLGLTVVGAACGAVAAALIYPVHTSPFVMHLAADVFEALGKLFECLRRNPGDCCVGAVRALDGSIEHLLDGVDALYSRPSSNRRVVRLTNRLVALAEGARTHGLRRAPAGEL